jgi:MFS family permease
MTGIYISGSAIGGFLGRFLTGLLADPIGWRGAFLAVAALTAICALGVILLLPREKKFVRAANLGVSLRQMLDHLRKPQLLATFAVGFGVLFNFIAAFTFINFLLAAPPYNLPPAALAARSFSSTCSARLPVQPPAGGSGASADGTSSSAFCAFGPAESR